MSIVEEQIIINKKYQLYEQIGHGKFGKVYSGINRKTKENVAIKMENIASPIRLLKNEAKMLKYLYDCGCRQIPLVLWYGIDYSFSINHTLLIMPYYEGSLHMVSSTSLDKAFASSIQILESIHKHFVLHRDIKPDNFMVKSGELFLIDFGMATFYIDGYSNHIIESGSILDSEKKHLLLKDSIVGTPNYVSYNIHSGILGSRRDDMISLGYMYLMLHNKSLPWENIDISHNMDKHKYEHIHILHPRNQVRKIMKTRENLEKICIQTNQKIYKFLMYCYDLEFDDKPDYDMLLHIFMGSS
jgi:serine/threonine protein kinase